MSFQSSFVWQARHLTHLVAETLGISRDQRPQTTELYYEVKLKNRSSFPQTATLILPEPQSKGMQTLISPPGVTPAVTTRRAEERFGNIYCVWELQFEPQEEKGIEQHCVMESKPINTRLVLSRNERVSDYILKEDEKRFLVPGAHTTISDEAAKTFLAEINPETTPVSELLNQLQEIVLKKLRYGDPIDGLYSAEEALTRTQVDCGGFCTLFIALCQRVGIPARLMSGFWTSPSKHAMHVWVEALHPSGVWIPIDPSVEWLHRAKRITRSGSIGFIGSDRAVYSIGTDHTLEVSGEALPVDFLQTPILLQETDEIQLTYTFTSQRV